MERAGNAEMVPEDVTSDKRRAVEVFAEHLSANKGRKLTEEDVKAMLRSAFQGCDLAYVDEAKASAAEGDEGEKQSEK